MTKDDLPPLPEPKHEQRVEYEGIARNGVEVTPLFDRAQMQAYALAAIAAHDAKREKVLMMRTASQPEWSTGWLSKAELAGKRYEGIEYAWAYIEREGA